MAACPHCGAPAFSADTDDVARNCMLYLRSANGWTDGYFAWKLKDDFDGWSAEDLAARIDGLNGPGRRDPAYPAFRAWVLGRYGRRA